ncbi:isoform 2 of nuclear autoantigenic sperm protein [Fagus crenata]
MCFKVDCKTCGKTSWGGCGKHLPTLFASIDQGKHCLCRSWPGVVMPSKETTSDQASQDCGSTTKCFSVWFNYIKNQVLPPNLVQGAPSTTCRTSHGLWCPYRCFVVVFVLLSLLHLLVTA